MAGDDTTGSAQAADAAQRAAFLEQMRQVPGAVAVISAATGEEAGGLVATAWSSLCADPPMLLACVNRTTSAHDLILRAGAFGLSLLSADDQHVVGHFSGKNALTGKDRFVEALWSAGPEGQPLLDSATVSFECTIETTHSHGTHTILIGRVGEMRRKAGASALLYLDGKYAMAGPV
ncbi:flavin reductase family protein [Novosphingobium piscinae]|uniref:Flavin reductase family protein n=1 Tax=Novosphingobium piscinae TaxID=1507448 RepID=A0A7X1KRA1_9SPHN|nr:flavin reductase family protein [Novosphingobium piscinae]MBC2670574.1 flavin reductase family protein [Novosphingobium piscinae]